MHAPLRIVLGAALALALAAGPAAAGPIAPGLDYLKTQPGSSWDFASEPVPSDYFGPGSDPFDGQVVLLTETDVLRPGGSDFPLGADVVPTEIVALTLHSAAPIAVSFGGGAEVVLYDVVVTLDPAGPNAGHFILTSDPTAPGGGGMIDGTDDDPLEPPPIPPDSFFDVSFRFEFIPHGPPGQPALVTRADTVHLIADVPWSNTAPPCFSHPRSGAFYPGIDPFVFPPGPCVPVPMVFQGEAFTWVLALRAVPEPGTLALLALGGLRLAVRRRRSRHGQ